MSNKVELYVVFDKPADYPDLFVVRKFLNDIPDAVVGTADTLQKVREYIPEGLVNIGRHAEDDSKIVEVWI